MSAQLVRLQAPDITQLAEPRRLPGARLPDDGSHGVHVNLLGERLVDQELRRLRAGWD